MRDINFSEQGVFPSCGSAVQHVHIVTYCVIEECPCTFQSKKCSLHVGQLFSMYDPRTEMSTVVSKESAPGLIVATGSLGETFKGYTALYVSVDAGMNFYQVFGHAFCVYL